MPTIFRRFSLAWACLALALVSSAPARTIYVAPVDPTQPTKVGTGTAADPYRSLSTAYATTVNGDTLRFYGGSHYGGLVLNKRLNLEMVAGSGSAVMGGINLAPRVNAGTDQTFTGYTSPWPAGFYVHEVLRGTATDDAGPASAALVIQWSKVSGPDTVSLVSSNTLEARLKFWGSGRYVFRLQASDGLLSAADEVTVVVTATIVPPPNEQLRVDATATPNPIVLASPSALPATANLQAWATLDGQAVAANRLSWYWYQTSGPGTARFGNRNAALTTVELPAVGSYEFKVTVRLDGNPAKTATKSLTLPVLNGPNGCPSISGPGQLTLVLGEATPLGALQPVCINLPFTVTDDGRPAGVLTQQWAVRSGPNNGWGDYGVTFSDRTFANPWTCFRSAGAYVLRLIASDGLCRVTNDVRVFVELPASRYLAFTGDNFIGGLRREWVENTCQKASIAFRATLSRPDIMPSPAPVQVAMTLTPKEKRLLGNYAGWRVDLSYCAYTATPLNASTSNGPPAAVVEDLNGWQPSAEPGTPIVTLTKPGSPGLGGQAAELELYGDYNYDYEVQATTNLLDWVPVGTWPGGPVGIAITDEGARQLPNRFYRVLRR